MKRTDFFKSLKAKGVDPSLGVLRSIVAADLHAAMVSANLNQSKLASKLGWSRARVSQVFSGDENLTVETISQIANACGFKFDVAFRRPKSARAVQPWEIDTDLLPEAQHHQVIWKSASVSYDMKGGLSSKENDEVPSTKSIGFLTTVNDEKAP